MGGIPAAHALCAAEFPGAHLCHTAELALSHPLVSIPAAGAWLDGSQRPDATSNSLITTGALPSFGRSYISSCGYHAGTVGTGNFLNASGAVATASCATLHPLACCNGAPGVLFAGFTSANAVLSGRPAMHAACDAQLRFTHVPRRRVRPDRLDDPGPGGRRVARPEHGLERGGARVDRVPDVRPLRLLR
jgi:3',5'-cyclic AMP phosphodiesterase CpdA